MTIKTIVKSLADQLPYVRSLNKELAVYKTKYQPGHFYSPLPSIAEVLQQEHTLFTVAKKEIDGVDLQEEAQLQLLERLKAYYSEFPFTFDKKEPLRYHLNNQNYTYSDAVGYYSMLRHFKPARVTEVGSGFSSALLLDVNDLFFDGNLQITFIEPYPKLLYARLSQDDARRYTIIDRKLQEVDVAAFSQLEANDILFIDSTHVSKIGSDVNYIFFHILPALKSGVLVHIHDIFFPFEYPKAWILKGRAWNENYLLRAFLQYNSRFTIRLFNTFLEKYHAAWFQENMPLCLAQRTGSVTGSIWLQKQ